MTRETLHELVDGLPETELQAAARYLEFLSYEGDELADNDEYIAFLKQRVEECDQASAVGEAYSLDEIRAMANQWITKSSS
jgi:hypothetical protein